MAAEDRRPVAPITADLCGLAFPQTLMAISPGMTMT